MSNLTNLHTQIIIGNIIHCSEPFKTDLIQDGFVIVQGRKILALDIESALVNTLLKLSLSENTPKTYLKKTQILVPGLIDTHIHAPQYPNCGLGYDKPLLEWLDSYTYKLERQYKDQDLSKRVFEAVVKKTLSHGTTTACYFASLFANSSMLLVDAAIKFRQRALVGKINMTLLAPEDYVETPKESIANTLEFIKNVQAKNSDLILPIITPRFALSVDMEMMKKLGIIAKERNLHIQTHIAENKEEVKIVKSTYKMEYAQIYNEAKLLTNKTILAHGIYLKDEELETIAKQGTSVSHCPDSNTCLKSGLCDVKRLIKAGIKVGLGSDVSGGPSPSIVSAMKSALDTSIHISFQTEGYVPLTYTDVFYLATLGGAQALSLDKQIGNFQVGKDFDALIVDMDQHSAIDYLLECKPMEILQKFIYAGDDRNIITVFVAGQIVK